MSSDLILSIEDADVQIGGRPFFEDMTFHIHQNARIALVGRNGAGKTTLMNMITGAKELDGGTRWIFPGISIGYMQQHVPPVPGQSVRAFVFSGLEDTEENAEIDPTYKIEMVVEPLGLSGEETMDRLSGGELRRAALARALVEDPDILLLDEPTNHLDLEVIEWLEGYLKNRRGALVCVSHDRTFLANITNRIFWLDRGALRVCPKGFAHFDEWSQELLDQEARELKNREKQVQMEVEWASRGVKARRKRNQRRLAQVREDKEKLEKDKASFRRITSQIELPAPEAGESARILTEFFNCSKSFYDEDNGADKIILDRFNMRLMRKDRIGILGRNGSGKTSFIKLLIGDLEPDQGKVKRPKDMEYSYFDQRRSALDEEATLQENLCPKGSDHLNVRGKDRHVCGYLKDFLFDPQDAWRPVKTLSGGQKNRLMLARVLADPKPLLILDEPTNDLDMDTLEMLEGVLKSYDGTLILVSHDRDFLDKTVTKVLAFEGDGQIEGIIGGYSDYLAFRQAREKAYGYDDPGHNGGKKAGSPSSSSSGAGNKGRAASGGADKAQGKSLSFTEQHELDHLPQKIGQLQKELARLEERLADPDLFSGDPKAFHEITQKHQDRKSELEAAEERWLELEELKDR